MLYGEVNKVENLLLKFDRFVQSDVLLTMYVLMVVFVLVEMDKVVTPGTCRGNRMF
jgi:hypothetical protein